MASKPREISKSNWGIRASWQVNNQQYRKWKSGFTTAKAAKEWASEYEKQQVGAPSAAHKLTVNDLLDQWIAAKSPLLSPNTRDSYITQSKKAGKIIGLLLVQSVRVNHCQKVINSQTTKATTTRYLQRVMHAAFEYARKMRIIKENPWEFVDLPEAEEYTPVVLAVDEARQQLAALAEQYHPCYIPAVIALLTGCRRGEALGLRWSDIDFEAGIITITNQYTRNGNRGTTERKTKTKKSSRQVALPIYLADTLKAHKERQEAQGCIETHVCADRGHLPNLNSFTRKFNDFQKANGFTVCRFHDLRHSYAEMQLEAGTSIKTIQELLGHAKMATTCDMYLHDSKLLKQQAADKIDNIMSFDQTKKAAK